VAFQTWLSLRVPGLWIGLATSLAGSWLTVRLVGTSPLIQFLPWGLAAQMSIVFERWRVLPWIYAVGSLVIAGMLVAFGALDFTGTTSPGPEEDAVRTFSRLMSAEGLKLRRSAARRLVWLLPLLFLLVECLVIERPFLGLKTLTPKVQATFDALQLKMVVALWGGYFHPLMLALLPALIFRPEHRFKTWRHLHAMPLPRRGIFLAKAAFTLLLSAAMLALIGLLLWVERSVLGWLNPLLAFPFHGLLMAKVLGWLWLGSLPVLGLYLWVSDRINSLAVPVVFGLLGLLLTIALTGQELPQPWRRDLLPWILPYAAAERVIHHGTAQQEATWPWPNFSLSRMCCGCPAARKYAPGRTFRMMSCSLHPAHAAVVDGHLQPPRRICLAEPGLWEAGRERV